MDIKAGRQKTLLTFFSFSILSILLIYFLVIPITRKVYQQKDFLEEAKLTLSRDQENIDEYRSDLEYLENNSFLNEGLEVNENNRVELIEFLEEIAKKESLELKIETFGVTINRNVKSENNGVGKTILKLSLRGDYESFLVFVYQLQNSKYIVNIDKLIVEDFDEAKMRNIKKDFLPEELPEIEGEIVISFNEQKI